MEPACCDSSSKRQPGKLAEWVQFLLYQISTPHLSLALARSGEAQLKKTASKCRTPTSHSSLVWSHSRHQMCHPIHFHVWYMDNANLSCVLKDFLVFVHALFPRPSENLGQAAPTEAGVASAACWKGWEGVLQTMRQDGGQAHWLQMREGYGIPEAEWDSGPSLKPFFPSCQPCW